MNTRKGGYTLIELLAGIFLSAVLLAALYSVFTSQQVVFSAQEQVAEMTQSTRAALDLMTREIRLAGYKTSTGTFNGIPTATAHTIQIMADLDLNGDTSGPNEDITYTYDSASLQIYRNGSSLPVADNITDLSFLYTLADGSTTSNPSNPADIRKVKISISARTHYRDRGTGAYRIIVLTSDVTPRNLAS
jgi:prepilin-type N-terminal cleavage/methylation domain-containing protein